MDVLTKELISLHGKEGLRAEQWFDLMIDDVLAGFGLKLTEIPADAVQEVLFNLSGLYAREVIRAAPFEDILGPVHMDLVSQYQQKGTGQFFTPPSLCRMIAQMSLGDFRIEDEPRLIRVSDPAVGAGGMLLAAMAIILENCSPEALKWFSLTGIDIDRRCARMFPVQVLSGLFVHQWQIGELVSYRGNTLGNPAEWSTVCHYSRGDLPARPQPADHPIVKKAVAEAIINHAANDSGAGQLALF